MRRSVMVMVMLSSTSCMRQRPTMSIYGGDIPVLLVNDIGEGVCGLTLTSDEVARQHSPGASNAPAPTAYPLGAGCIWGRTTHEIRVKPGVYTLNTDANIQARIDVRRPLEVTFVPTGGVAKAAITSRERLTVVHPVRGYGSSSYATSGGQGDPAPGGGDYLTAALLFGGDCIHDCRTNGWTTSEGEVSCDLRDCLKHGWSSASGAQTTCVLQDCLKHGWSTQFPDGSVTQVECTFLRCASDGWVATLPDGSQRQCRLDGDAGVCD